MVPKRLYELHDETSWSRAKYAKQLFDEDLVEKEPDATSIGKMLKLQYRKEVESKLLHQNVVSVVASVYLAGSVSLRKALATEAGCPAGGPTDIFEAKRKKFGWKPRGEIPCLQCKKSGAADRE